MIFQQGSTPEMTREELTENILSILENDFEFEHPGLDDNLRDDHGFDSIDAGISTSDYADEPVPNGGRVNIGAYGNTNQASRTPPSN